MAMRLLLFVVLIFINSCSKNEEIYKVSEKKKSL